MRRQFPDELLKKAQNNVPALEKMKEELLGLATEASVIMSKFRQLVLDDRGKNDLDRLLEEEVGEYESCIVVN